MGLKKLYESILSGQLDVAVRLDYRHSNLTITLRSLLRLSGEEIQAMMAEPTACMAFASKYSWDEESPQGRRFAAMCGESACLGAMLTEVSTHHLLQNMNTHLYHSQDPAVSRPQDSHLQTVQVRPLQLLHRFALIMLLRSSGQEQAAHVSHVCCRQRYSQHHWP